MDARRAVVNHLLPLRDPARQASQREHDREHFGWNSDRSIDDTAVEIDIRVELLLDEIWIVKSDFFELLGDVQERVSDAERGQDFIRRSLQDRGPRIKVLVDAMTEAHQLEPRALVLRQRD